MGIWMTLSLAIPGVLWLAGEADIDAVWDCAVIALVCVLPIGIVVTHYYYPYYRAITSPLSLEEYLAADLRPPVLYLRPFQMERYPFTGGVRSLSFEEFFLQAFRELGPFVALGNPEDYLPVLRGAVRLYASDVDWIQKFAELARRSAYIVVETARADNLQTEYDYLRCEGMQEKLFVFTGHPEWEHRQWLQIWGEKATFGILRMSWQTFSEDLVKRGYDLGFRDPGLGSVMTFDAEGRGIVLTTQADTAAEFVGPIRAWVERREKSGRCVPTSCLSCGQQFYVFPADTCKIQERWCKKCGVRLNVLQRVIKKFCTRHQTLSVWVGFILVFSFPLIIFGLPRGEGGLFPEDSWAFQHPGLLGFLFIIVEICVLVAAVVWASFRADQRLARRYQNLAESGDAVAMSNLGIMYRTGKLFGNGKSAGKWFRKAAEAGDIGGMINLAEMLEKGIGLQKDPIEAVSWYQRAAELGSRAAQLRLKSLKQVVLPNGGG
jgi:Sel1 repeat